MKAIVHANISGLKGLTYEDISERAPGYGEVKVKLKAAGLNHRDLFIMEDRNEGESPLIIGSDGAGRIEAVGEGVFNLTIGANVIINPCIGWEMTHEVPSVPAILGGPSDGTFAEYVTVPATNVVSKPAYLSWEEAGVLPLSALTAYRALFTRGRLQQGEHILIPGIGGGVATYAMLMALAVGAKVSVTSRSETKRQAALSYGAEYAFDSHSNWKDSIGDDTVDLILDSIGPATFRQYFDIIKPNGRIVMFGASSGDQIEIPIRDIFFPQINIIGTSMGSSEEFTEMLQFMERHSLHPIIDKVYPLQDTIQAFHRMKLGDQLGNIGIRID
ncbi:zinc-binding alcohol dehydrogenase/oxidoreductase [Paenibacillus uliginis N3/975]|uniref:Zinc-binding alcohol dehydrogenase/oxidoreductase n=1 Tax=Paenibacillus uliginis N3/975 TaxID=1313296 RepID=A0A1X7HFZ2_9BACL|nr:zinc-binding dehydrogenase [Paenibacillus uliginis]SMF84892.1 zinc-binding alcohol dehydrogenase/oxidoreductase [Paenibacillus uliginis N3/975]